MNTDKRSKWSNPVNLSNLVILPDGFLFCNYLGQTTLSKLLFSYLVANLLNFYLF
jgi:hypothetical protein